MKRRPVLPVFTLALLVAWMCWFLFWPVMWLELELTDGSATRQVKRIATAVGEPFSIRFVHSVELRPVTEYFVLDEAGALVLTGTRYYGFGAGLPTDGGEGTFAMDGDAFVIRGLQREIGELQVRLSPLNEYAVVHRNRSYDWPNASSGARLRLRGVRTGRLVGWLGRVVERSR